MFIDLPCDVTPTGLPGHMVRRSRGSAQLGLENMSSVWHLGKMFLPWGARPTGPPGPGVGHSRGSAQLGQRKMFHRGTGIWRQVQPWHCPAGPVVFGLA